MATRVVQNPTLELYRARRSQQQVGKRAKLIAAADELEKIEADEADAKAAAKAKADADKAK